MSVVLGATGCRRGAPRGGGSGDAPKPHSNPNPTGRGQSGRIELLRGFDRKEVPNLTLHVLEASTLKVLKRVELALDNQVLLEQIGPCRYFRAEAANSKPRVYQLDDGFQLTQAPLSAVPSACWTGLPRVGFARHERRCSLTLRVGSASRTLPLPNPPGFDPSSSHGDGAVVLNRGRSVLVASNGRGAFFVPDVQKPRLQTLDVKKAGVAIPNKFLLAADVQSRVAFLATENARTLLFRLDPLGGRHVRLADLGYKSPEQLFHLAREHVLLYRSSLETALLVIDDRTGQIRHRVTLAPGERHRGVHTVVRLKDQTYVFAGRELIDIGSGQVVAELPNSSGPLLLSADHQYLYYSLWSPASRTKLTIQRYDLAQRRVSRSVTLQQVGHGKVHTYATLQNLVLLPGGQLLVVGGDSVHFLNHHHH